jgi:DNA-binding protein HU-beta
MGVRMNKTQLISRLSEETSFSKKDVTRILESFTKIIERNLKKGEKVSITGFGTFLTSRRSERLGINPTDKRKIKIPSMTVPKFKPGKKLRQLVRSSG